MRILATDGIDASAVKKLTADGFEVVEKFYEPAELAEGLKDFDVVVVRSATKLRDHALLDSLKGTNLKMIIRAGVGLDNIDVPYATACGFQVKNTPRSAQNAVAELAMGHILSVARNISISGYTMRNGQWEKKAYSKGIELKGKTLGIVGFGRIGQRLGEIAKAFGMNVVAFDIFHVPGIEEKMGMKYVEMDELLACADVISVHAPAVNGGALIDKDNIAKMKDGVIIVNTSRGSNVDEAALLEALNSGKVMGAGLDVYMTESISNPELIAHPHVSCTPHIGSGTKEAQKGIGGELVEIIEAFAKTC
ncbi:MAG: D-2-hydroxyacid dehydrogenase [Firmicutes bacterium]|nr:D-2-hydroxyacid dehydrogenase [Bacillota bacterium]